MRWRQSRPGIESADENVAQLALARRDQQLPRSFAHPAHGLEGVKDQVEDDLLQFHSITWTNGRPSTRSVCARTTFFIASLRISSITSRIAALMSTRSSPGGAF